MATPPPLPPRRSLPPTSFGIPEPGRRGALPPALPGEGPTSFDPSGTVRSDRDIQEARGRTFGVWVSVNSQALNRIRFDPEYDLQGKLTGRGTITIEYLNLSQYEFPNRLNSEWFDLFESSSKGRYNWYRIRGHWPHRMIRGPQRRVTAAMRRARAPQTAAQARRTFTSGGRRGAYGQGGMPLR